VKKSVKTLLMDQKLIGGLGNICAIEILFRAGVSPDLPARELTDEQARRIAEITPEYLEWGIAKGYVNALMPIIKKQDVGKFKIGMF